MNWSKPGSKLVHYFRFFYGHLGGGMFVGLLMSLLVATMDGFGLAMFLPLLQSISGGGQAELPSELTFIFDGVRWVGLEPTLSTILLLLLFFFCLKGVARFGLDYYRTILNQRLTNSVRLQNLGLLVGVKYDKFTRSHSGTIQNTLSGEVARLNDAYINFFQLLQYGVMMLVYSTLAYLSDPGFALILVVGGILSNVCFRWINRRTQAASAKLSASTNSFQGFVIDSVASFKFLKATGLIATYYSKIKQAILETEHQRRRIGTLGAVAAATREPLIVLVVVLAIFVQVIVFSNPLGLLVLSLLFFYRALTALTAVQVCYNTFLSLTGSVDNVIALSESLKSEQEAQGSTPYRSLSDGITVSQLSFAYGNRVILHNLSLLIRKNETIGIVGESGSGKTTLVNILSGLLPPPPGTVLVDGYDINDLNKKDYRRRIGYVTQEAQVFSDSVRNNVTFWKAPDESDDEAVWSTLRMAHAANFVTELPAGLNTQIGINGVTLSGGQRQRLSIARELYRGIDILFLDEATSALDSRSEQIIQRHIDSLSGKLTVVVVAHRLATVRKADKIVFLTPGGGHQIGTFATLYETSPPFRKMVALQTV